MTSRESEVMTMTLQFDLNEIDTFVKNSKVLLTKG